MTIGMTDTVNVIKKKGKKRKISKHILDAKLKSTTSSTTTTTTTTSSDGISNDNNNNVPIVPSITGTPSSLAMNKKQKTSNQRHVKDPIDVEGYLLSWQKHHQKQQQQQQQRQQQNTPDDNNNNNITNTSSNIWKFNKNTQSWLIRHLYDSTKINKSMFTIALEYIQNSNHINMIQRIRNDALQRAIQYQEEIKNGSNNDSNNLGNDSNDTKTATGNTDGNNNTTTIDHDNNNDEVTQQSQQKRKEYKRARKILDTLKEKS